MTEDVSTGEPITRFAYCTMRQGIDSDYEEDVAKAKWKATRDRDSDAPEDCPITGKQQVNVFFIRSRTPDRNDSVQKFLARLHAYAVCEGTAHVGPYTCSSV